jgi:hypothetical protein
LHENKVIGEVNRASDRKVVVRLLEHRAQHLRGGISRKEHEKAEIHTTVFERAPENGVPGAVVISVDTTGIPVQFTKNTDSGNHKSALRHATYLLEALGAEKR